MFKKQLLYIIFIATLLILISFAIYTHLNLVKSRAALRDHDAYLTKNVNTLNREVKSINQRLANIDKLNPKSSINPPPTQVKTALLDFDVKTIAINGVTGGLAYAQTGNQKGVFILSSFGDEHISFYDINKGKLELLDVALPQNNKRVMPEKNKFGYKIPKIDLSYTDIEVISDKNRINLLVLYNYYNKANRCFTSRLAVSPGIEINTLSKTALSGSDWKVVYETQPCIPILESNKEQKYPYIGHQSGGRMAKFVDRQDVESVYLTIGDYHFDGYFGMFPIYPQLEHTSYGKIYALNTRTGKAEMLSMGHRNPQGIAVDEQGNIWSVEHGPKGGDELNLIEPGENYGWPYETYGLGYGSQTNWVYNKNTGRHLDYKQPVFAWLPSIGVSNVKVINGIHPRWNNDLLVSALHDRALYRIRLSPEKNSVIYAERIGLNDERIRYVEVGGGRIFLMMHEMLMILTPKPVKERYIKLIPEMTPQSALADMQIATTDSQLPMRCLDCHSHADTPDLSQVFQNKIASQPRVKYSDALKKHSGHWDRKNLTAYLSNPDKFAPGGFMANQSLSPVEIKDIINKLAQARQQKH